MRRETNDEWRDLHQAANETERSSLQRVDGQFRALGWAPADITQARIEAINKQFHEERRSSATSQVNRFIRDFNAVCARLRRPYKLTPIPTDRSERQAEWQGIIDKLPDIQSYTGVTRRSENPSGR